MSLPFTHQESADARAWLRKQGWTDGEAFVCLIVRDSAYLAEDNTFGVGGLEQRSSWAYHDYRNSPIETYLPAMRWLAQKGVWVIRMGKVMERKLPGQWDQIIDYAFDPEKSDLLDIWLFANCSGCISTSTGPDGISLVYQRPILYVNALPLGLMASFGNTVWVPKHLSWVDSGRSLSLCETLEHTYIRAEEYEAAGIRITDLDADEIQSAVEEFWARCTGEWCENPGDRNRQLKFWRRFVEWDAFSRYHDWIHPNARVGSAWLKSVGNAYFDRRS